LIDVRHAAVLVGRHPETIRRWVWSGRLLAQRRGRRMLVVPSEVQSVAGQGAAIATLRLWADRASDMRSFFETGVPRGSAADLVIEDRLARSGMTRSRARR
jgi:hypothetical protein